MKRKTEVLLTEYITNTSPQCGFIAEHISQVGPYQVVMGHCLTFPITSKALSGTSPLSSPQIPSSSAWHCLKAIMRGTVFVESIPGLIKTLSLFPAIT
ncbi:hypothetical protein T4D_6394 [Trichinella pseudospiralis]|uniref:Uncharacterized protein n=1 Tax=Trichinella pseudospiralis TaxID=6337 RepID=A0A0V1FGN5_TRIPS|nr:hypothetical protein T4D_6394 [Trichinella pseudospiralis]